MEFRSWIVVACEGNRTATGQTRTVVDVRFRVVTWILWISTTRNFQFITDAVVIDIVDAVSVTIVGVEWVETRIIVLVRMLVVVTSLRIGTSKNLNHQRRHFSEGRRVSACIRGSVDPLNSQFVWQINQHCFRHTPRSFCIAVVEDNHERFSQRVSFSRVHS